MNRRLIVFLLALVAIVSSVNVVCQAQARPLLTSHVREATLNGQALLVGRLPVTQSMHVDIVLALSHPAELKSFVQEVSDPSSPSYRHFVTVPEFTERFGPSQQDFDAVVRFAKANGFKVVGASRDGFDIQLKGSVANIEKAFHVTMSVYQRPTENRTFYSPDREPTVDLDVYKRQHQPRAGYDLLCVRARPRADGTWRIDLRSGGRGLAQCKSGPARAHACNLLSAGISRAAERCSDLMQSSGQRVWATSGRSMI